MEYESHILDSLRQIVQGLRVSSLEMERKTGISGAQFFVIQTLFDHKQLTVNDLAKLTRTHQSSVSVVVSRLVDQKLVVRQKNSHDARKFDVSLSQKGRDLLKKRRPLAQTRLIEAIDSLKERDKKTLARLLDNLVEQSDFSQKIPSFFFEDDSNGREI